MSASALEAHLLDLLVDGRSSFAALYGAVNRPGGAASTRHPVDRVWDALAALEESRWIRTRQKAPDGRWEAPTAARRTLARREYLRDVACRDAAGGDAGVCFEVEALGWVQWTRWAAACGAPERSVLELDPATSTITVHATDAAGAERALAECLRLRPGIEVVPSTRTVQPSSGFHLRDGTPVEGGVTLRAAYHRRVPEPV